MKILRLLGIVILSALIFFGLFLVYATITYYNPDPETVISQNNKPDTIPCDSSFRIMSWNIGYAGLGDNMDFFYDSGKKVRDTYERTINNLDSISLFLEKNLANSFFLIQEVDIHSKRSYYIREIDSLVSRTKFSYAFAPNYEVKFVPIPITSPMGQVYSGILSLSKYLPISSIRYSYPGQFGWPNRLFNLRRCMLVNRYPTNNGKEFIIINSHKSAFDDGSLKTQEMSFLRGFILNEYAKGNYVIVGGDWNQSPPDFPINTFGENYKVSFFKLTNVDKSFMPEGWKWIFDPSAPTNRYLNEPYNPSKTYSTILDFFLISPNIQMVQNQTINLGFRFADHNPVLMNFRLIK